MQLGRIQCTKFPSFLHPKFPFLCFLKAINTVNVRYSHNDEQISGRYSVIILENAQDFPSIFSLAFISSDLQLVLLEVSKWFVR